MTDRLWEADDRPDRPPVERELLARLGWIVRLRWLGGAAVALGGILAPLALGGDAPATALAACGALILAYNALFVVLLERLARRRASDAETFSRLASAQFITDWIGLSVLVHLTGGMASPLLPFFVFHAILASILLPPRAAWAHAIVGVLLLGAVALMEAAGVLAHRGLPGLPDLDPGDPVAAGVPYLALAAAVLGARHVAGSMARPLWSRTWELVQAQARLEAAVRRTRSLCDVGAALVSDLDLQRVLDTLVQSTVRTLQGRAASLRLLDPDTRVLRLVAAAGLTPAYLEKGDVDPERSPVDREVLEGRTVAIADVARDGLFQYPDAAAREGIRSVLCAPLAVRDRTIGVLRLYTAEVRDFGREDREFLATLAGQGAVAIENARAYRHLEELEHAKSRFVFQMAHQLKSPLSAVRSALALIEEGYEGEVTGGQRRLLDRAQKRSEALQDLVNDLMHLGALKDRAPRQDRVLVRLDEAVQRAAERVQPEAEARAVQVRVSLPGAPVTVRATVDDLDHLVGNLVDNAVKYTPGGGAVEMAVRRDEGRWVLTVRDTGIGIPEADLPGLFQEFYRAPNARAFADGTGLGLVLVRRLVDLHRGTIEVASRAGEGSTFTVTLPAA